MVSLGYAKNESVAKGMEDALAVSFGIPREKLQQQPSSADDILSSLGEAGLKALASSVEREIAMNVEDENVFVGTVHIEVPHHNLKFDLKMKQGHNLMQLARDTSEGRELLGEYVECACGGNMSCATCHVYLDDETFRELGPPCEGEMDMLDLAFEPKETSRLGCQIVMDENVDGMTVTIPSGVNNFWS
uniref:2Fe-2S ferredoxin-type domain-containing protein n=1 Tax=Leptocylindrus danicus TaxID=163516 RepID=A0A7S2KIH5_9STRA